jgi:hypothetical protein
MTTGHRVSGTHVERKGIRYCPTSIKPVSKSTVYSRIILSPFPRSLNLTSSNSSAHPVSSLCASLNASSTVHTLLFKNQLMNPPPFLTSSCVATQYLAFKILCANTPFFAPRLSCCAALILTSCSPCKNARTLSSGSAVAMGVRAVCGMPCGVYMTASAASPAVEENDSWPSPFMDSEGRCLRGVVLRKGCVAKVIRSAEW